jgi:hypothetical protein
MGQFLQVNGDYNIKTAEGAKVTIDTGPATSGGQVLITGNLIIGGDTTVVEAENLNIQDNIITLNSGEAGPGVSLGFSGLEIDRGAFPDSSLVPRASFVYEESTETWILANGSAPGPFNYDESNLRLRRIYTNPLTDDGDLTLIASGTGVIKVIGTINYEDQVDHDDDIPNKKYVDDAIQNNPTFQILSDNTRVIVSDQQSTGPGSPGYLTANTSWTTVGGASAVSIIVDAELVAQFYDDYLVVGNPGVDGIEIDGTNFEIRTQASVSDQNIFIKTSGTGKLQTNVALQLEERGSAPGSVADNVLIYAANPGLGNTGVFFVNDSPSTSVFSGFSKQNGELISKNKALVFSMIF